MDVPNKRDWLNIGAIVPLFGALFSFAFGFARPIMSQHADILWVMGIIVIAFLVWFNAAKTAQSKREDRAILNEIKQLLAKPGTTLEDVKKVAGVLSTVEGADIAAFRGTEE